MLQDKLNEFLSQSKESKQADYYILQCSPYPSVLVECGFVSNSEDFARLTNSSYREKFAQVVSDWVDSLFFEEKA